MIRALFLVCAARFVHGIIVKDPVPDDEYKYWYEVQDPTTGGSKSLHEVRHGDAVSGAYTVLDPDGTLRTVQYTADPFSGFKADVSQEPITPREYIGIYDELHAGYPPRTQFTDPYLTLQPRSYSKGYQRHKYFTPASELQLRKAPINGYFEPNMGNDPLVIQGR